MANFMDLIQFKGYNSGCTEASLTNQLVRKIIIDVVEALTRKSQACFQII